MITTSIPLSHRVGSGFGLYHSCVTETFPVNLCGRTTSRLENMLLYHQLGSYYVPCGQKFPTDFGARGVDHTVV